MSPAHRREVIDEQPVDRGAAGGWVPDIGTRQMCAEMVAHDLDQARRRALLERHGREVAASRCE